MARTRSQNDVLISATRLNLQPSLPLTGHVSGDRGPLPSRPVFRSSVLAKPRVPVFLSRVVIRRSATRAGREATATRL